MNIDVVTALAASVPLDWIILGTLTVLFTLDGLRSGPGRAGAAALALPGAVLLHTLFPSAFFLENFMPALAAPLMNALVFLVFFVALFMLLRQMDRSYADEGGQAIQALLCAFAAVAVFTVIWLQVPALSALWQFGDDVVAIFGGEFAFWWLIGSLAILGFLRRN